MDIDEVKKKEKGERLTEIKMRVKRNTEIKGWKAEEFFGSTWKNEQKKEKEKKRRKRKVKWENKWNGRSKKWEKKRKRKSKTEINIEEKRGINCGNQLSCNIRH